MLSSTFCLSASSILSPSSSRLFSHASAMATPIRRSPIMKLVAASYRGFPSILVAVMPMRASMIPISATVSSVNAVSVVVLVVFLKVSMSPL